MANFRHIIGELVLFFGILVLPNNSDANMIFSDPTYLQFSSQSRACQLWQQGRTIEFYPKNSCQGTSDQAFDPCVVHNWANALQNEIQNSLWNECQTETHVKRAEFQFENKVKKFNQKVEEYNQAHANAMKGYRTPLPPKPNRPDQPQMGAEQKEIMHRLYPNDYDSPAGSAAGEVTVNQGGVAYRKDSCLDGHVKSLKDEVQNMCDPRKEGDLNREADQKCEVASRLTAEAQKILDNPNDGLIVTEKVEEVLGFDPNNDKPGHERGHLEKLQIFQTNLGLIYNKMIEANKQCAQAIVALSQQCEPVVANFLGDEGRKQLIANNCTHSGFITQIDYALKFLGSPNAGPSKIRDLSDTHNKTRTYVAETLAPRVGQATDEVIAEMARGGGNRGTATVNSQKTNTPIIQGEQ